MIKMGELIQEMIQYEMGDPHKINHFLKVYGFAKAIGEMEGIAGEVLYILEIAAIMHDIGIKISLEKYGSGAGHYQEVEGPPKAKEILEKHGLSSSIIERVCFLIGHHHSYENIEGIDYQILVEADFLVNIYEGKMEEEQVKKVQENIFRTKTGLNFLQQMFM